VGHGVSQFIHTYPYLMLSLTMLGAFVGALAFTPPRLRSTTMLSGALAAPFALTSPLFVPSYWSPSRVAVALTGIEDLAFTFAGAGLAWLASIWLVRYRLALQPRASRMWWRYAAGAACGLAVAHTGWRLGAPHMAASALAFGALTAVILWRRRVFWRLAAAGSLAYAVLYVVVLKLWYVLVPSFSAQWNAGALWGPMVFGIPLDEVVWATAFGMAWPTFVAYLLDARLQTAPFSPAR
jgi:hypothetical protein